MSEPFYRTGQAGKALDVSSHIIRKLCETGLMDAEFTATKQWRIPASEVARLKRDGIPTIPQAQHNPDAEGQGSSARPKSSGLLDNPSQEAVESAESVLVTQNKVAKKKLDREMAIEEDWFKERQRKKQAEKEAIRTQQVEAEAHRRRQQFVSYWVAAGMKAVPYDVPHALKLKVHAALASTLEEMSMNYSAETIAALLRATIDSVLAPYRNQQKKEEIIRDAVSRLPLSAKDYCEPTIWQIKATRRATTQVNQLGPNASVSEMEAEAADAVRQVEMEFRHCELIEKVVSSVYLNILHTTNEERNDAKESVRAALEDLSVGTSEREMQKVREATLAPYLEMINEREEEKRCQEISSRILSSLGWDFSLESADRAKAERQLKERFGNMPISSTEVEFNQVKEEVLAPIRAEQTARKEAKKRQEEAKEEENKRRREALEEERRTQEKRREEEARKSRAESRAQSQLWRVDYCLKDIEREEKFEFEDRYSLRNEIENELRPALVEKFLANPEISDSELQTFIKEFVDEHAD